MQFDVAKVVGAVTREVQSCEHEGKPARVVVASRSYDTDIDDLWDALTNPERIPRWFLPVSGELKLGGRYQLQGNAGGTITACEPCRHFAATWEFAGGVTWLAVTLTPESAGRTRLELEHMAHVDGRWPQFGPGAVGVGWDLSLVALARHIDGGGKPVDPAVAAAWMASDEAKAFMRDCSEAWGWAAVAGGEEAAVAMAAAARTTAFYTGQPAPKG